MIDKSKLRTILAQALSSTSLVLLNYALKLFLLFGFVAVVVVVSVD